MGTRGDLYSLKWNHYQSYLTTGLAQLLDDTDGSMTDVTLACEGQFVDAHKIVLSICSPFFKKLFRINRRDKAGNTVVVLANVKFKELRNILNFMYHGQVNIAHAELNSFLQAAQSLEVEGLAGSVENNDQTNFSAESIDATRSAEQSSVVEKQLTGILSRTTPSHSVAVSSSASPAKRSRMSVVVNSLPASASSSTIPQSVSNARLSASSGCRFGNSVKPGGSSTIIPTDIEPNTQTPSMVSEYDPLGDMGGGGLEDANEEMISIDTVKSEPIAVYTVDENDGEGDLDDDTGTAKEDGNESSGGVVYEFESAADHPVNYGPGPSTGMARTHVTGSAKPQKSAVGMVANRKTTYGMLSRKQKQKYRVCTYCGGLFYKSNLSRHKKQAHPQLLLASGTKLFSCGVCGQSYRAMSTLKTHMEKNHC